MTDQQRDIWRRLVGGDSPQLPSDDEVYTSGAAVILPPTPPDSPADA